MAVTNRTEKSCLALDMGSAINGALAEARKLQITRIAAGFTRGWRMPEGLNAKYRARFVALLRLSERERGEAYLMLFATFKGEVERAGGFPAEWNDLDCITIFGEVCTGERTQSGVATTRTAGETLH